MIVDGAGGAGSDRGPAAADDGLECRRCGCFDLPVYYTRRRPGKIVRSRVCAHCGQHCMTIERVTGGAASLGRQSGGAEKSSTNGTISENPHGPRSPAPVSSNGRAYD